MRAHASLQHLPSILRRFRMHIIYIYIYFFFISTFLVVLLYPLHGSSHWSRVSLPLALPSCRIRPPHPHRHSAHHLMLFSSPNNNITPNPFCRNMHTTIILRHRLNGRQVCAIPSHTLCTPSHRLLPAACFFIFVSFLFLSTLNFRPSLPPSSPLSPSSLNKERQWIRHRWRKLRNL